MTQQHTPGPWDLSDYTDDKDAYEINANKKLIAEILNANEANARLIAAAPELLELAEGMLGFEIATPRDYKTKGAASFSPLCRYIIDLQNKARKIIAEATGDT